MQLKKLFFAISISLAATFPLYGSATTATTNSDQVSFSSPSTPIRVQANHPEFTLTLQSNPTTGYSWFLGKYDSQVITALSHQYVAPNSKLAGAGGYEVWTFKINSAALTVPRTTKLVMQYARPWDKIGATRKMFEIYISP